MHDLFHKHLIVNAKLRKPPRTAPVMDEWLVQLVDEVGMVILFGPNSIRCDESGNEGVTGTVGLTTSHSSIHVWDTVEEPFARFDLYSCRDFQVDAVIKHMLVFEPYEIDYVVLDRNHRIHVSASGYLPDTATPDPADGELDKTA